MRPVAVLSIDGSKCTGCQMCLLACSAAREGVFNPLRATLRVEKPYTYAGPEVKFSACDGCLTCREVCPTGAISLRDGHLHLERELCTECGLCVEECPRHVIVSDPVRLCDGCDGREGGPACVMWCPVGALSLGQAVEEVIRRG
ncbi:MAG: 4Fe-4S binding protein [Bacillota bacterium]